MEKESFLKKLEIELKIGKNSPYTQKIYQKFNKDFLEKINKLPDDVTEDDVKEYIAENLGERSAISIIMFLAALKYSFSNILKEDITRNIHRPKRDKRIPVVLTKKEIFSLLEELNTKKSRLMVSLMYATGMRVSEVASLKVDDLNFEERIGQIKQGKGRKDRMFNIPNFIFSKLKRQAIKQKEAGQKYLFSGRNGEKMSSRNLQKIVKLASIKAGIKKDVHCHTLRHSFATHLLEDDVDIRKIQVLLGHASISTTEIYAHVSQRQIKGVKSPLDTLRKNE